MAKRGRKPLDIGGSTQISLRIPDAWLEEADAILAKMPDDGMLPTRVDVLRKMIRSGLNQEKHSGRR
jgi:hypothetical protein